MVNIVRFTICLTKVAKLLFSTLEKGLKLPQVYTARNIAYLATGTSSLGLSRSCGAKGFPCSLPSYMVHPLCSSVCPSSDASTWHQCLSDRPCLTLLCRSMFFPSLTINLLSYTYHIFIVPSDIA